MFTDLNQDFLVNERSIAGCLAFESAVVIG